MAEDGFDAKKEPLEKIKRMNPRDEEIRKRLSAFESINNSAKITEVETAIHQSQQSLNQLVETEELQKKQMDEIVTHFTQSEITYDSAQNYLAILNAATESIILMDPNGIVLSANTTAAARFGKTPEQMLGFCIYDLMSPELAETRKKIINELIHTGKPTDNLDQRDGRTMEARIYPVFDSSGKVSKIVIFGRDITERNKTENDLLNAKEFNENLIETANAIVVGLDTSGKITIFNKAAEKITGYQASELQDRNWFEVLTPRDHYPEVWAIFENLMIGGLPKNFENPILTKNGQERYIVWQNNEVYDQGQAVGTISFGIDITERKRIEEALSQSEERFKVIASNTPDHVIVNDRELRYSFVLNPQLGLTEKDMIGKTDYDFLAKEDAENLTRIKRQVLETGNKVDVEVPLISLKGETEFFSGSYIPKYDANGQIEGLIGYFRNVTDHRKAEKALQEAHNNLKTVFESITDSFFSIDSNRCFTYVNSAAEKLLRKTAAELLGKNIWELFPPAVGSTFYREYERAFAENVAVNFEEYYPPLDTWFEVHAHPSEVGLSVYFRDITERKLVEKVLKDSEERFRILTQIAPAGIYLADKDGKCLYVNEQWQEMSGLTVEESMGYGWTNGLHPDDRQRILDNWNKMVESKGHWGLEYRFRDKKGKITWVHGFATPQYDENGNLIRYVGVNLDITDRKNTDEALRASESRYRELIELAVDGILLGDKDGHIIGANAAIVSMIGMSRDDLLGQHISLLFSEDVLEKVPLRFDLIKQGLTIVCERPLLRRDGINMVVEMRSKMMPDGTYQSIIRDVTERKLVEEALRESEERFKNIVNSSPMGMHLYELKENDKLVFIGANPASDQILKVSHNEFIGKTIEEAFPGLVQTEVPARYRDAARNGTMWRTEQISYDEGLISGAYEVIAFQTVPGKMVAAFHDITDRKRAEEQLKQTQRELEHTSRLILAGELASGLAHELNQPLCAVANYTEACSQMLSHEKMDLVKIKDVLDRISTQTIRAGDIIKRLRKLVNKQMPCTSTTDINEVIYDVLSLISSDINHKNIVVEPRLTENLPLALVDNVQIQQVFINLIKNAVEVMQDSDIENRRLTIETSIDEDDTIIISFKDTGKGIAAGEYENIFSSFYTTKKEGLGLGLSLSRSIIEAHGGYLWAEPNPQGGAVFRIRLPLKKAGNGT